MVRRTSRPAGICVWAAALSGLLLAGPVASRAAEDANHTLYLRYCGSCHGPAGKGDGILASVLQTKPANLTQIAKKNGGEFPSQRVVQTIDGTTTMRAHGDPEMPVWGEVLRREAGSPLDRQVEVQGKIMFITEYLRSIQEK